MNNYFRKSLVRAEKMTRLQYNNLRGWPVPLDEDGSDIGYIVEDINAQGNTKEYEGYISWVPEQVFKNTFHKMNNRKYFNYGIALEHLKNGLKVARKGWNGTNMFIYYVPAAKYPINRNKNKTMLKYADSEGYIEYQPYLALKTVNDTISTWVASISDTFAEDYYIVK